jgi:hypothetical protein
MPADVYALTAEELNAMVRYAVRQQRAEARRARQARRR